MSNNHKFPLYPYSKYPENLLNIAHEGDLWIPLGAMVYTLAIFIFYLYQYCQRKRLWLSKATKPLHIMAIIALATIFVYELILFILAHNYYTDLPSFMSSCHKYIRITFIVFVIVKYSSILCIVMNISYINQNPFINPRYKYIGKRSRIRLRRFFRCLYVILILLCLSGLFSAWIHTSSSEYSAHNYSYCTQTMSIESFFWTFGGDICGVLLYSFLFGRNACKICRRPIRPQNKYKYDRGNLSDVDEYDDDKHYDYNKIDYDDDDPIITCLESDMKYSINVINAATPDNSHNKSSKNIQNDVYGGYADLIVDIGDDDADYSSGAKMSKDSKTVKKIKRSTLIEAEENITDEEFKGIREQQRILRLVWIMLVCYWINILLLIFLGLFENISSFTLILSSTCILLLNDYEFGSNYWMYRNYLCKIFYCICCLCRQTYFCNNCFCGEEKIYKDDFNPNWKHSGDRDDMPKQYQKFVRL